MWHFISSWVLGLDLGFFGVGGGGGGVGGGVEVGWGVFFKMEFCWGVGWFYFNVLGDYFLLRGLFVY